MSTLTEAVGGEPKPPSAAQQGHHQGQAGQQGARRRRRTAGLPAASAALVCSLSVSSAWMASKAARIRSSILSTPFLQCGSQQGLGPAQPGVDGVYVSVEQPRDLWGGVPLVVVEVNHILVLFSAGPGRPPALPGAPGGPGRADSPLPPRPRSGCGRRFSADLCRR